MNKRKELPGHHLQRMEVSVKGLLQLAKAYKGLSTKINVISKKLPKIQRRK